jgi:exonuclease SbcC
MRILAIRGENLASLSDPFEVDFESEPIRSAGIFAITGPTGAGKTTLLDAICLALFDSLPRMDSAEGGASIGRVDGDSSQQAKYDDVRGILRHGAGAGYAEVDFVGQDGRRYRSRWEVNRARSKSNGKLQSQKITLTDIESREIIGDKKTDTLQQIEKRIGLSFHQFRRSVLLAQGDFDTFIKAGSKERAELLERITGTEIYSQLSQAAFAKAKQERETLQNLETQLGEHQPLADEARATAEERVKKAKGEVESNEVARIAIGRARDWYDAQSRLDTRVVEGSAALTQALECDQTAAGDRATLAMAKMAFSLRAELETASTTSRKLAAAETGLAEALEVERRAIEEREHAVEVSQAAKAVRDENRAAYDAIGPALDEAKRLDAVINAAKVDLASRKVLLVKSVCEKDAALKAVTDVEVALKSVREQRENDARWLEDNKSAEALSIRIVDVENGLSERLTLERGIASTTTTVEQLDREVKVARTSRLDKEAGVATLQQRERELDEQIGFFRNIGATIDTASLDVKRDKITHIQAALDDTQDAAGNARKTHVGLITANEEVASQDILIRRASDVIAQVDAELPSDMARMEEARRSLDLSEAAGSEAAEHLRLKLEEGQPCPVCGATDHPVTDVDRLLKDRVSADHGRVVELETKISTSRESRTRAETQIAAAKDALKGISGRKSDYERELQAAQEKWQASVAAVLTSCCEIGLSAPAFAKDASGAESVGIIGPFRQSLDTILGEVKETIKRASDVEAEAKELSLDRETIRASLAAASGDIVKLREEEHTKSSKAGTLRTMLQGMEQNLAALCLRLDTALASVFPDWREKVADISGDFVTVCRDLVDNWRACRKRIEAGGAELSRLEAALEGKRATLKASESAIEEAEKRHADKNNELGRLIVERMHVIEGRPAEEVRTEYRMRSEAAEKLWNEAEPTKSRAEQVAAAMSSNAIAARTAIDAARSDHESAEWLLAEKLQACDISRPQAESAIVQGEAWIAAEQARLDNLREALATARATLAERQQSAKEHEATGRPKQNREEIIMALVDTEERRVMVSGEFIDASSIIRNDDQARSRMAEIKIALDERREKARVWGQLDDLIGSSDGTKFRRFAQSLTLNHLIRLANRHLTNLHPRYELQRAPGSDLVLQVIDRNMADEVRGVHNLSGGERFLVSLSLALGLAGMSSSRGIKVESLFIDEGFGALDSNSLAMAVSVLEQLQATGRRVGVISHVDEMKERIAVKVEVTPAGGGRSTVQVVTV